MFLHITNGDSAAIGIVSVRPGERVLSWRDVLHEGPVPAGLSLQELSEVRAGHISAWHSAEWDEVRASFQARDATLTRLPEFDEVVLWFEHDLYDQLQLIQILDWFREFTRNARLTLIQADDYLGPMTDAELAPLWERRKPVEQYQLDAAHTAWDAFRSPHPTVLGALINNRFPGMPYLGPALYRFCEEYPSVADGCSRTERVILQLSAEGITTQNDLYAAFSKTENPIFMGDTPFFNILAGLKAGDEPLLDEGNRLTGKGRDVFLGNDDRVLGNGIDKWLGGVHLRGEDAEWRWDTTKRRFALRRP